MRLRTSTCRWYTASTFEATTRIWLNWDVVPVMPRTAAAMAYSHTRRVLAVRATRSSRTPWSLPVRVSRRFVLRRNLPRTATCTDSIRTRSDAMGKIKSVITRYMKIGVAIAISLVLATPAHADPTPTFNPSDPDSLFAYALNQSGLLFNFPLEKLQGQRAGLTHENCPRN